MWRRYQEGLGRPLLDFPGVEVRGYFALIGYVGSVLQNT